MTHHIMFDARVCNGKTHGIARVAHKLLEQLAVKAPYTFTLLISNDYLRDKLPQTSSIRYIKVRSKPYTIREQWELPRLIKHEKTDLFHSASFTMPFYASCPVILTIFDLIPVVFPEFFPLSYRIYYRLLVTRFCQRADRIFTSSEHSRADLTTLYNVPNDRIRVIYCAATSDDTSMRTTHTTPYILYMGNTMQHKNFIRAVEAFSLFKQRYSAHPVTLKTVGIPQKYFDRCSVKGTPDVEILDNVSDSQLYSLMANAGVFFFPSLYEGFGLPPLEAMNQGTPVVGSHCASLPEVLGDAYLSVDPYNTAHMADALYSAMTDTVLRESLISKGRKQVLKYSWDTTAQKVIKLYKEILQ